MAQAHTLNMAWYAVSQSIKYWVRRAWAGYWDRRARAATVSILRSLDDCTLRDIGMDRSEIESVVYGRRGERRR
jgi:uncharacterized protein YjiS (DUF1127 family)